MAVVTAAEFEALKASGWNSLDTTYDISYKSHWTMWHAIREFVQNAIDEHDEAGTSALPTLQQTHRGLVIADQGRGIGAEALLLRETKRASGDLRGRFGEGLKFACITALREGYGVRIGSPVYTIQPIVRDYQMVGKSFQIVAFLWKAETGSKTGTEVLIERYRGPDYRERFFPFARSAATVDVATVRHGRFRRVLSLTTTPANSLYVGDIFVRELGEGSKASPYSYNLWGIELDPDRVAETHVGHLHQLVAFVWRAAPQKLIERLLTQMEKMSGFEATVGWDYGPKAEAERWHSAWNAVYGEKGVLWTSDTWGRLAESFGYQPIHMPVSFIYYLGDAIPTDQEAVKRLAGNKSLWLKELSDTQLTAKQLDGLQEARRLTTAIVRSASSRSQPAVMAAKFSMNPETGTTVNGLWDEQRGTVLISDDALVSDTEMLKVLFHELGHWLSKATDLTAEHTEGVGRIGVYAMEAERARVAAGAVGVAAGPTRKAPPEMGWVELVARGKQAGIQDADGYSKAVLRRMLGL